ncbi:hypothetical protein CBR_g23555 [Chara braunii]|uniref:Uncharacterized protein n=1 Tax=Chara braunii TaxID=69332 RepID=A0A388L4Q7_CHABU|nr:hypothetical protein CBR_g23555 [Chara braunii]|eukprot:GBG77228.1 hypothetical protein CBR_g23555 [Chara braunii]
MISIGGVEDVTERGAGGVDCDAWGSTDGKFVTRVVVGKLDADAEGIIGGTWASPMMGSADQLSMSGCALHYQGYIVHDEEGLGPAAAKKVDVAAEGRWGGGVGKGVGLNYRGCEFVVGGRLYVGEVLKEAWMGGGGTANGAEKAIMLKGTGEEVGEGHGWVIDEGGCDVLAADPLEAGNEEVGDLVVGNVLAESTDILYEAVGGAVLAKPAKLVNLQQNATQQLEQRICTAATHSRSEPRETTSKFDDQEIFYDSTKTDPILWFRKFELKLQLHYVSEHKHHMYVYSRSGGTCQAWLDNLLSKYGVVVVDLHTKISWDDLQAARYKRFQVELSEIKAMDKLMTFEQGALPSVDWIADYQRLTSVPYIQMGFKAIKHYFISRSCPMLGNALTHVKDTLTTPVELFDKAVQIIVTNEEPPPFVCDRPEQRSASAESGRGRGGNANRPN